MKINNLKFLVLLMLFGTSAAQAQGVERFDIVSYTPPAGWSERKTADVRVYSKSDESSGTFCMITLLASIPSTGNSRSDFTQIWKSNVAGPFNPTSDPQMGASGPKQTWTAEVGIASFEAGGLKGAAMLTTMTGNGRVIGVIALTNSDAHAKDIEAFVDGIILPQAAAGNASPVAATTADSKLIGKWNRSSSGYPSYGDAASWGTAGYTKSRYEFKADRTYVYTERSFRMIMQNIIVAKETGRYSVNGNSITITPLKSTISSYRKDGGVDSLGPLIKSQERDLETVTYKFTLHYFEGIQEWNLVLQADRPTKRDGPFSGNTTFPNAWYFDQKFIDNDLTSKTAK